MKRKIRIAVAVDRTGLWASAGASLYEVEGNEGDLGEAAIEALHCELNPDGGRVPVRLHGVYYVTAEVDFPEPHEAIEGEVEGTVEP